MNAVLAYGGRARSLSGSQKLTVLRSDAIMAIFFEANKNKWPLLMINWRIRELIWRQTAYFVQKQTTIILHSDARGTTIFGAKLEVGDKMFHIFHLLQCYIVLGIVNHLSWIFNAPPMRKVAWFQCLSCQLTLREESKYFPPAES